MLPLILRLCRMDFGTALTEWYFNVFSFTTEDLNDKDTKI
jgi:hypothetical protein